MASSEYRYDWNPVSRNLSIDKVIHQKMKRRVILDTDVGTDDFLTILIFLYGEKLGLLKIEAIVCSAGNTTVANVTTNVVRLLELTGRTDIPVYRGASNSLVFTQLGAPDFHGHDGFGDLDLGDEVDLSIVEKTPAAVALYELVSKNPGELSLVCLAPLTNIALAIKLYDDFSSKVKDVWLMGGNHQGVGNVTSCAEFNFHFDPEAAYIVLENIHCPLYILPWETCLLTNISCEWRFGDILEESKCKAFDLLTIVEKKVNSSHRMNWMPCDAYLGAAYLFPEKCIVEQEKHCVTVELHGSHTRGQLIIDHCKLLKRERENITIIKRIDDEFFKDLVLKSVS